MREIELIEAIKKRCADSLKDLRFGTADAKLAKRAPIVLRGSYPPNEDSAFVSSSITEITPFVIVRLLTGEDVARDEFRVQVEIIVQIFNDHPDMIGDEDCLLAMNRIRANIQQYPILENKFHYDGGWKWELNDSQAMPNWQIQILSNWLIPNTQRIDVAECI
ncbi:hypothetical protein [Acinetobacter phage HFM1]|nr:hypothetical protein [Acinetobacter phage HFM1]